MIPSLVIDYYLQCYLMIVVVVVVLVDLVIVEIIEKNVDKIEKEERKPKEFVPKRNVFPYV